MRAFLLIFLAFLWVSGPVGAQEAAQSPETAVLDEWFEGTPPREDQFTRELLIAAPLSYLAELVERLRLQIGEPTEVRIVTPGQYLVVTETHQMAVTLTMNPSGKIMGLFFSPPVDLRVSAETLLADLAAGDRYAYLVVKNGTVLYERDADIPLAVGSAFKLGVLAVLNDQITAGTHRWDEVVTLTEPDVSLPSGTLQQWEVGAPLTLHTLASMMISISDNTAADVLMRVVGRTAVEEKLGTRVITTREFFALKAHPDLLARYNEGDETALKEAADLPLPGIGDVLGGHQPDAEWYLPLTTLCKMMDEVGGLGPTHINPGVATPGDWDKVAYKGGNEPGVFNLTTRAISKSGNDYCVSVTWNDDAVLNEQMLSGKYAAVLSSLSRE